MTKFKQKVPMVSNEPKRLPQVNQTIYPITLPISGLQGKFRAYLKRDDKILLEAVESKDEEVMTQATLQVLNNCLVAGDFDITELPMFDVQYFMLQLRKRSVGPTISVPVTCHNKVKNAEGATVECKGQGVVPITVDEICEEIQVISKEDRTIMLTDEIGVVMTFPTWEVTKNITKLASNAEDINQIDLAVSLLAHLIDQIFEGTELYESFEMDDVVTFIENLNREQFGKLEDYLEKLPSFNFSRQYTCKKCGVSELIEFKGFESFLA